MRVTENPVYADDGWEPCVPSKVFEITSEGDGQKSVHAWFKDDYDFLISEDSVSDDIVLDTEIAVSSFSHTRESEPTLTINESVAFTLDVGESGGEARADLMSTTGVFASVPLLDQGDGTYLGTFTVTQRDDLVGTEVRGYFTDIAGNGLAVEEAGETLDYVTALAINVAVPPVIQSFQVQSDSANLKATLTFVTDEPVTAALEWGETSQYEQGTINFDNQVNTSFQTEITEKTFPETEPLAFGIPYYVRLTVTDESGNAAAPSLRTFFLRPDPPQRVVAMGGDGRLDVRWEAPEQWNVTGFHIYRALGDTTDLADFSRLTATPYNHEAYLYQDTTTGVIGGPSNVTNGQTYSYYVTAIDNFGNESAPFDLSSATPLANGYQGGTTVGCATCDVPSGVISQQTVWSSSGSPLPHSWQPQRGRGCDFGDCPGNRNIF